MMGITFRHIIFSFLIACLTVACTSHEPRQQSGSSSMIFSAELRSRADLTDNDNFTSSPFAVYSDMVSIDRTPESPYITIHDATRVSYDATNSLWYYDNVQYWFPGFQYSFVALHPAVNPFLTDISYSNNRLQFIYTQPNDYTATRDVLMAVHRRDYDDGPADAVRFGFAHILTNINVKVTYNGSSTGPTRLDIIGLTFRNIPTEASYAVKPASLTGSGKMTSDWISDEGTHQGWTVKKHGDLNIDFPAGETRTVEANKGAFPLFSSTDALMLLPNLFDADNPAELDLHYITDKGDRETASATIPTGWDPGANLTLSLIIDNSGVQFSFTVEPWKDGTNTNTTVPRK